MKWQSERDEIGFVHRLWIPDADAFVKVEKSAIDYTVTAMRVDDPCGGDLEYFDTLAKAKRFAEKIAATCEWRDYLP